MAVAGADLSKSIAFGHEIHNELVRRDLTNLDVFTIDPPTARDLDDGISVRTFRVTRTRTITGTSDEVERLTLAPVTAQEALEADE